MMDAEQFHDRVAEIFKAAFTQWDFQTNPLEWESLPQQVLDFQIVTLKEALALAKAKGIFGAPFHIVKGEWGSDFKTHTPPSEAIVAVEILPVDGCDDWAGEKYNLADVILKDAEEGDHGWSVQQCITALEGTIARLKRETEARGWTLGEA